MKAERRWEERGERGEREVRRGDRVRLDVKLNNTETTQDFVTYFPIHLPGTDLYFRRFPKLLILITRLWHSGSREHQSTGTTLISCAKPELHTGVQFSFRQVPLKEGGG